MSSLNAPRKSKKYYIRETCRLCNGKELTKLFSFGLSPLANSFVKKDNLKKDEFRAPLEIYRCTECNLVQISLVVSPKVMFDDYLYVSSTSRVFIEHFKRYALTTVDDFNLRRGDLVVDVGSNDGTLLKCFNQLGMNVIGVEPAKNIAEIANAEGIHTKIGYFNTAIAEDIFENLGQASVITANNVFAHTDNLDEFVNSIKVLLKKDGVFIFEVQYLKDLVEKNLFDIIYHEHLCYFHVSPLLSFFNKHGMTIFRVMKVPTHGGSIRVYAGFLDQHEIDSNLKSLLLDEIYLNDTKVFEDFYKRVESNKKELRALISGIKISRKRIVGYGAPAKATTFCTVFDITREDLEYIVDDDTRYKQGMYLPGNHIPIKDPGELYLDKPDYCLILSWNFKDSIINNHKEYIKQGGKFIVPVPAPKIIEQ